MKQIIEFELEDGSTMYMEANEPPQSGPVRAGGADDDMPRKAIAFKKAIAQVRPAAEIVVAAFQGFNAPAEISLEFALKFNSKVGTFLIASADSEVAFKLSLKWTNPAASSR